MGCTVKLVKYRGEGKMRKYKYLVPALLLSSVLLMSTLAGCAKKTTSTTPARSYEIVKTTDITDSKGGKWKIYQIRLTLDGGATFTVDLNLSDADKVDLWYTTEKPATGGSVDFQVKAGTSIIYAPVAGATGASAGNTTDRLSFVASQANGTSYRLVFRNKMSDINSKETIFAEIAYPAKTNGDDSIFIPMETN